MFDQTITLNGGRLIGRDQPSFIVAELSGNHNRSFDRAAELIRLARDVGADAVKLQTYTADTLTIDCDKPPFRITGDNAWKGRVLHELYKEAYTPWEWHADLFALARELGLEVFSTPFDRTAVDFLEKLKPALHKIASFELVDHELVRYVAQTGKPVLLSTGMASEQEIDEAVAVVTSTGNKKLVLLKCTSAYPAPLSDMNIRAIPYLSERFGALAGLSDHSPNERAAVAAVSLGASVIEKHLTKDRADGGVDSSFSLNPDEFARMVEVIRETEQTLGRAALGPGVADAGSVIFRRSIFAVSDIPAGATLSQENIRVIRPGHGLAPKHLPELLGRKARSNIERGTPMAWDLLE